MVRSKNILISHRFRGDFMLDGLRFDQKGWYARFFFYSFLKIMFRQKKNNKYPACYGRNAIQKIKKKTVFEKRSLEVLFRDYECCN